MNFSDADREYIESEYFHGKPIPADLEDYLDCKYGSRLGFYEIFDDPLNPIICDIERYTIGILPMRTVKTDDLMEENRRLRELLLACNHDMDIQIHKSDSEQLKARDRLITLMLCHIQNLMKQIVALRYVASFSMEDDFAYTIRGEIFSDLYGCYESAEEFRAFLDDNFDGENPMESWEFQKTLYRLARGEYIRGYPFNYASMMKKYCPSREDQKVNDLLTKENE